MQKHEIIFKIFVFNPESSIEYAQMWYQNGTKVLKTNLWKISGAELMKEVEAKNKQMRA